MPLVGFRPTVARLVIENTKDSVLVLKVVVDRGEAVELTTGGALQDLQGVLRIRERGAAADGGTAKDDRVIGSVVYVAGANGSAAAAAKFQINVSMAADKFATLIRVASAGRLPAKFFVDAGNHVLRGESPGLGYRVRSGGRMKVWDNYTHRALAVRNFVMILPIDVPSSHGASPALDDVPAAAAAHARVADLTDDVLVFQSERATRCSAWYASSPLSLWRR